MTLVLEEDTTTADIARIVIADDHVSVRGALKQALSSVYDFDGCEAGDLATLCRALSTGEPTSLVLLDLAMPGVNGFPGLLYLRSQHPDVPIIVMSDTQDRTVMLRCIEAGAAGYIPKGTDAATMRNAIQMVLDGEIWMPNECEDAPEPPDPTSTEMLRRLLNLTPQQLRVLMMLFEGLLNKQIAFELKVSEATVKAHVSAILQKLDVDSRTQAVIAVCKIDRGQFTRRARIG